MNTTGVPGELREMWETRPARPRDDRQIAGVAAAIARRYDIDPVLVRVGFVASGFFGLGGALYLAGRLVLPDTPPDPAGRQPRRRGLLVVGLGAATIASTATLFGGRGGFVVPLLVTLALLYLLHRSRADRGIPGGRPGTPVPGAPPTERVTLVKGVASAADEPGPPSWDPLGAAPFAWDLPEPGPATPPPPRRRRPPVTAVTLGLALIAGAVVGAVLLLTHAFRASNAPIVLGVVLAALGLGLVVGAFVHAGRGLVPFALLASLLTWLVLSAPLDRVSPGGFGDLRAAPTTVAQLQPQYQRGFGDVTLDLRGLDLSTPTAAAAPDVRTSVQTGAGDVTVLVPAAADVRFTGESGLGDVAFAGEERDGPGAHLAIPDDLGRDGLRQGRLLVIDVRSGAGDVEVRRG